MKTRNLWRTTLLGALALPYAAFAQAADKPTTDDSNMPSSPSDMKDTNTPAGDTSGKMDKNANPTDTTAAKEVTGTISKVGHNEVWLNAEDGTKLTLHTDSMTKVYKPTGTTEKMTQLKEGQQIRASYDMKADQPHALRIDVMPSDNMKKP
jgi:hypothetical protein